jgi:uncharacterized membrane protein
MEHGIGDYVVEATGLASLALEDPLDQETIAALNSSYNISNHRTVEQDPAFGVRQIVDIALKALSPGVNDTSTAVMCIDYLAAILARLASRQLPSSRRYEEGELRVITIAQTFKSLLDDSFDQIRRSAEGNVAVMERMFGAIENIASLTTNPYRRRALCEQIQRIDELADRTIESAHDRARIEMRLTHLRQTLESEPALCAREEEENE